MPDRGSVGSFVCLVSEVIQHLLSNSPGKWRRTTRGGARVVRLVSGSAPSLAIQMFDSVSVTGSLGRASRHAGPCSPPSHHNGVTIARRFVGPRTPSGTGTDCGQNGGGCMAPVPATTTQGVASSWHAQDRWSIRTWPHTTNNAGAQTKTPAVPAGV